MFLSQDHIYTFILPVSTTEKCQNSEAQNIVHTLVSCLVSDFKIAQVHTHPNYLLPTFVVLNILNCLTYICRVFRDIILMVLASITPRVQPLDSSSYGKRPPFFLSLPSYSDFHCNSRCNID
jgi:hypothetical protein